MQAEQPDNLMPTNAGESERLVPGVFIIESLSFQDEKLGRFEGKILSQVLQITGAPVIYVYLRTARELDEVIDQFDESKYRYLHFSCHGSAREIGLTLDEISFAKLRKLLGDVLENRRIFFSSCEVACEALAKQLMKGTGCYSLVGPSAPIEFDRAAVFWAAFYHLMLRDGADSMKHNKLRAHVEELRGLLGVEMRYFRHSAAPKGYDVIGG